MDIYVGNLPYTLGEEDIRQLFEEFGTVEKVKVMIDFETQRSKGFGFVTMTDENQARTAMEGLDGRDVGGRALRVNPAQQRPPRQFGEGGGGRREGGYRDGGGGGGGGGRRDNNRGFSRDDRRKRDF